MGCDYYCWIETVVQYLDASGVQQSAIEGEEPKRRYVSYGDPDFNKPYGLNEEIADYGKRALYENGAWVCLPSGKLRIEELCYAKKIPFAMITSVFKFKNGYWR